MTSPLTAAVIGQNGIQWYIASAVAPPDRGEDGDAADYRYKIGHHECSLDGQAVPAELRNIAAAQQQKSFNQAHGFPVHGIRESALQLSGLWVDPEQIPADAAVGSGNDKTGRMNVLIERRLVPIRETDRIGDPLYHLRRAS